MDRLTALHHLEITQDLEPERLPCPPNARDAAQTPLSLAAVAELSGMLGDVADDDVAGLVAAAETGLNYVGAGILSFEQWEAEILDLCQQQLRWLEHGDESWRHQ